MNVASKRRRSVVRAPRHRALPAARRCPRRRPRSTRAAAAAPSPQAIANAQRLAGAPGQHAAARRSPLSSLRTFAEVTRDAKESPGLFNLWQRDDKVWIEIQPDQLERPYFFSTNLDQGLGESRFLAGSMTSSLSRKFGGPAIVVFRKVGRACSSSRAT